MKKTKSLMKILIAALLMIFTFCSFYDFIQQTNILNTQTTLDHLKDVGKEQPIIITEIYNNVSDFK